MRGVVALLVVLKVVIVLKVVMISVCGSLVGLEGGHRGTFTSVSMRLGRHRSLVPRLMSAMGNCTARRGRALSQIVRTHGKTIGTYAVSSGVGTRGRLASTLSKLGVALRTCPSLGTGRGFLRLRRRVSSVRGGLTSIHHCFGSTAGRLGGTIRAFPSGLVTDVFNFRGRVVFSLKARRHTGLRRTPGVGFWAPRKWLVGRTVRQGSGAARPRWCSFHVSTISISLFDENALLSILLFTNGTCTEAVYKL